MMDMSIFNFRTVLLISVAPLWLVSGQIALAQEVIRLPQGANDEPPSATTAGEGFTITIDGGATAPPAGVADDSGVPASIARQADLALTEADLRVTFDGLNVQRRLTTKVLDTDPLRPGFAVRVQSQMNYPAFVNRAEMRLIEYGASRVARVVQVVPVAPNGVAVVNLPTDVDPQDLAIVHRVYDTRGRFDETAPRPVAAGSDAVVIDGDTDLAVEDGTSALVRQRIPIFGGAVTVSGDNVPGGARVQTLGEDILPDPSGSFVIQRILPPGDQPVAVEVVGGPGQGTYIERNLTIPRNEWFYTATADLTFGWRQGNPTDASGAPLPETYDYGRLAGFARGRTSNGWTITASADTTEDDLSDLFRDFDKKDPQDTLLRAARENAYPTFGDDSTLEEGAPTDGKFYLKAERDGSHLLWGNFKASLSGSRYLRNERTLYGFQGVYRSPQTTERGEARVAVEAYGASPDRLPGREIFQGTGGSIYFLRRQDISVGSETLTVQIRDGATGRVLETRVLQEGRDYDVNYLQGVITLASPLTSRTGDDTVVSRPGGSNDVVLIANYEYTPTASDIDGLSYGARAEAWVTDDLRLGFTGLVEQTDIADQTALGADVNYRIGLDSYVALEYAQTEGPGFGSSFSSDGGLTITSSGTAGVSGGTGRAVNMDMALDFADLGSTTPGRLTAYFEDRTAGFSTLDYQSANDEELWGVGLEMETSANTAVRLSYDDYSDSTGKLVREGEAVFTYLPSAWNKWDFGVALTDKRTPGGATDETGRRTDVALRYTQIQSDTLTWNVFGQATVDRSGGLSRNNRVGVGVAYQLNKTWTFEGEISDGSTGVAGEALLTYQSDGYDTAYFGYRLEPGRDFSGVTLTGKDRGTFVVGGKRRLHDSVDAFVENTYDLFGEHRSLTSAYGVEYRATEQWTYSGTFEFGRVRGLTGDDFDRNALSLGVRYKDGERLQAAAKLEYRLDDGVIGGADRDQRALFLTGDARYKIDERQRLIFRGEFADSETSNTSIQSGEYADVSLGYAFRPITDDRLNFLFKYRFLYDMIGQEIDGTSQRGPRQRSHVLSADLAYDLNPQWTLGAKIGGRWSESAPDDSTPLADNDAWLAVLNARFHVTHKWDLLLEGRHLYAPQASLAETAFLAAGYRHIGNNLKIGVGYNFGSFSDDLTDLTYDDMGLFLNIVAKF